MSNQDRENLRFRPREDFIPFSGLMRYIERNEDGPYKEEFSYLLRDFALTLGNGVIIAGLALGLAYSIDPLVRLITK